MFTPSQLEQMPIKLEQLMSQLEMNIMQDIIRRIKINDEITRSADWQIYRLIQMGKNSDYIKQQIQQSLKLSDAEINKLYESAIESGYTRDKKLYEAAGKEFLPFKDNTELQQLIQSVITQTRSEMVNITQTMGFAIDMGGKQVFTPLSQFLQQILDNVVAEVITGTFDYNSTLKNVVQQMTKSGLRTVDYASGWSNRVEVAARRALMTGITQVTGHINENNATKLGTDKFEVTWHAAARPTHQEWQGRIYTKKQLVDICGYGSVTGLKGANCSHDFFPFVEGISERTYTDEQLAKMNAEENKPKVYNGKEYTTYEATQRQRQLETLMRKQRQDIKLLESGGAVEDDIINAKCRYQNTMRQYKLFSEEMRLPQQKERVYMDGLGRVVSGGKLAISGNRDIMKIKEEEFRLSLKNGNINTTIKWNKQREHLLGTKEWKKRVQDDIRLGKTPSSSFLKEIDHNELISNGVGKGTIAFANPKNKYPYEFVQSDTIVGRVFNAGTEKYEYTKRFAIHYSSKGIHAHPVKEMR